jgi:hypothetical protein
VDSLTAGLRVAHAWDLPVVSVELAASLGAAYHHQSFETDGRAPPRATPGAFLGIDVGASMDLGAGISLFGESGVESHVFASERSDTRTSKLLASWAFVQRAGVGKVW